MAIIKKLPSSEILKLTCNAETGVYFVTQRSDNRNFYLYKKVPDGYEKLSPKGSTTPTVFDEIIWQPKPTTRTRKNKECYIK